MPPVPSVERSLTTMTSDFGFRISDFEFSSSEQLREDAVSARGGDAHPLPGGRGEIAEAVPYPEVHVGPDGPAGGEQRHVLPRMVRRDIRGLTAVIGRH